jgi:UDP-N-acetylglucosamine/UDP-N-acetylgalactosamine diphosphorylase
MMNYDVANLGERLRAIGQAHLLAEVDRLSEKERERLINEIMSVDFSVFERAKFFDEKNYDSLAPIPIFSAEYAEKEKDSLESVGLSAIASGKVGAVLLCGGQGTRLGYPHPKGMFNIGTTKEISIFSLHFRYLKQVAERAGAWFPIYIMTSIYNRSEIEEFLMEKAFFGFDPSFVFFFEQNMAPATDFDGKIYKSSPSSLELAPDGNGGWFSALVSCGYLDEIRARGVEWLNVVSIDNVLQKTVDPRFIGATMSEGVCCGAKVVKKANPDERIGLICENGGHPSVIEYYELDKLKKENTVSIEGLDYGVILNYLFSVDEMEKTLSTPLPVHRARKKIPYYDGEYRKPEKENGYKYEMLATDLVERMPSCLAYEILREKEFAPVKNLTGVDSVDTAREMLLSAGYEL